MEVTDCYDRGQAALVLVSCFVNHGVAIGVGMYPGVYVAAIIDHYGCTRADGYVIGALSFGLLLVSGPIASASADKTSYRIIAVSGGLLATAGLVLSANGTTLTHQYVAFSITGIGCGFLHQSSVVVVTLFFRKYLKLATSIIISGGGVSLMVYPIICQHVIDAYAWQPSQYIIAGICLNTCVTSMFIIRSKSQKHEVQADSPCNLNDTDKDRLDTSIIIQHRLSNEVPPSREDSYGEITVTENLSVKRVDSTYMRHAEEDGGKKYIQKDDRLPVDENDIVELLENTGESSKQHSPEKRERERSIREINTIACETRMPLHTEGILKSRDFWLFLVNAFLLGPSIVSLTTFLPDMYNQVNLTESKQSVLFAIWGAASIIGRILSGSLWPRVFSPVICYTVTSFLWTSAILLFTCREHFVVLVFANGIVSLMFGSAVACTPIYIVAIVGLRNVNQTFAYYKLLCGIGSTLLPPLVGYIYDDTFDYTWPVLVAAILGLISSAAILPTTYAWRKARVIYHEVDLLERE